MTSLHVRSKFFENLQSLHIDEKSRFSDHNKLMLSWSGQMNSPVIVGGDHGWGAQKFSSQQCVADGPKGWCFRGSLSEAAKHTFCRRVALDSRLHEVEDICCAGKFLKEDSERALRLLHTIIREAWEREGLQVQFVSGKRSSGYSNDYANRFPIDSWFDDECREFVLTLRRAKRRKDVRGRALYNEKRNHFKLLKCAKKEILRNAWREFWSSDPREVWHFIHQLMGKSGSECE